jgi:DNA repair protein RecO (recombination protein O)
MKLESFGILIDMRPCNERDCIARIFSYDYGIIMGIMRAAQLAKKNRPLIGQIGTMTWNARLDSQLGVFHWESEKNLSAPLILSAKKLMYMNAAFGLITTLLPEREQYQELYKSTIILMDNLANTENIDIAYQEWEIEFLSALGYALDMTRCSGCGTTENLTHLSPRTGRAVCMVCAQPYIKKLYPLPLTTQITFSFIEKICQTQGVSTPYSRKILM